MKRRTFFQTALGATATIPKKIVFAQSPSKEDADRFVIGPKPGYSPQIGTLVSMMKVMRWQVIESVKGLKQTDLDFLLDKKANTIGALLMRLAATDTYYHLHTFGGKRWDTWDESVKQRWDVAMKLGEPARNTIKGHDLRYYLDILEATREKTFAEFRKRDDQWLLSLDKDPDWKGINHYLEWFHVCEHESNHNGQIKLMKGRLPGAKPESG
ncbi:MAG: DUF664 domain-containing protein [Bryobacteraceae bacterium]